MTETASVSASAPVPAPTGSGPAPASAAAAPGDPLALPITAVVCMEDRAQVERAGRVDLAAGPQRLRIGPVTPLAVDRSLRAEIAFEDDGATGDGNGPDAGRPGVRVVDARVVRAYTPPPPGEPGRDASVLRREAHTLEVELREAELLRQRLESRLAVVAQTKAELYRDITEGAGAGDADPERWVDRLERVDGEADSPAAELHALRRRIRDAEEELAEVHRALEQTETEPERLTAVLEVVVEADRPGPAELRVIHLVPCALWRPAYRATLAPDGRSVRLETDAFVWQRTGEDWDGVRLSLSTARPTIAASPPSLTEDALVLRDRSAEERRTVEVDLREEEIRTVGAESPGAAGGAVSAELPGLQDGGEVRVMAAPAPVRVVSDGRPHRVALSAFTAGCRAGLACSPELSPLVAHVARFANEAGHVLLAGPVDLVRGSGFVGRGELEYAGLGEEVRLSFGSEDTYRVVRHVEETRGTAGLTGINHRTVITRTVRLFVSRLDAPGGGEPGGGEPATVVVQERIPVSEVSAVEVRLKKERCRPAPDADVDSEGVLRYGLRLAPGERREIRLEYELTASSAVVGL
ncbi:DUF4139 domain-containing protein [Streptomyces sp. GC420]|uniref:DUF4139 domain-containing protein n=1 Tax=Streptomyces sp. GC420 TaxID=2697568 RepID=UPI001415202B|nr:DUF4139 domain-containing protein [Streptomyces sp. GC420]NBM18238.1 mucoidy inhibitor MuiA family protein [Streptomyces sp. GC420]